MRWVGLAALGLIAMMVAEVVAFVAVAHWLGLAWALAIVLAVSVLGGWLVRREGARGWRRFRAAVEQGRPPGREATEGFVGLLGALLLTVPGFVTDLVGLVLLLPPGRGAARSTVQRLVERRVTPAVAGGIFGPRRVRVRRGPGRPGTAEETVVPPTAPPVGAIEGEILPPRPGEPDRP